MRAFFLFGWQNSYVSFQYVNVLRSESKEEQTEGHDL